MVRVLTTRSKAKENRGRKTRAEDEDDKYIQRGLRTAMLGISQGDRAVASVEFLV